MQKTKRYTSKTYGTGYKKSGNYYGQNFGSPAGTYGHKTTGQTGIARGYGQIGWDFEHRARSYRMLWDQTRGACKFKRPTPTTLKTFSNWINKGSYVWKVTNTQINRWCDTNQQFKTCASVKNALWNRFGKSTIKAVTFDKSGHYLVVTAPTYKGKPFCWPH
jgi:hypothetical protein